MNGLKEETLCTTCIHKNVCESIRKNYMSILETVNKMPVAEHIHINVLCDMFVNAGSPTFRRGIE